MLLQVAFVFSAEVTQAGKDGNYRRSSELAAGLRLNAIGDDLKGLQIPSFSPSFGLPVEDRQEVLEGFTAWVTMITRFGD